MQRKTIILLFGGESSEHEVSITSARNVFEAIDKLKFEVVLCYIDRSGKWWSVDQITDQSDLDSGRQLVPILGESHFVTLPNNSVIKPDVILPILHGKNGEDGAVQALASLLHIPIVGSDMASSSLAMDKIATKKIVATNKIPIVDFVVHRSYEILPQFTELAKTLGDVLFVKPAREGSSVGVNKVRSEQELVDALKFAHNYDDIVLIERAINARELEVAVLGNSPNLKISGVGEIKPDAEFYSYESKYDGSSKSVVTIPADISNDIAAKLHDYAINVFNLIGCSGLARIDFFLDESDDVYFNEINTMPGFTDISMYPKLWMSEGLNYTQLISELIDLAVKSDTIDL